jgi:type II secretory ATPase GspE/PulE/Tfp pilus assembly ATPase PilB-like protein/ActR/RegA family two-component response regulator
MGTSARKQNDEWLLTTLEGLLTGEQFAELKASREGSFWEAATRQGWTTDDRILESLSQRFRMKLADLGQVSQQAKELVAEQLARKYSVLPLQISDSIVDIATSDPQNLDCERTFAFALGRSVRMWLASPKRILERLDEVYRPENVIEKILEGVSGNYDIESVSEEVDESDLDLGHAGAARPVIQLVDRIVAEGIQSRASDIHLEPEEGGIAVRYRVDGVLRQAMVLPKAAGVPLVSRVKIMAQLDIADRLRPQDGRARVAVNGSRVDLRVSTLPAAHGEKVVIRILDQRSTVLSLDALGMNPEELARVRTLMQLREGIILVTGPTGSGKTTTLYSMLREISMRGVNIVTVEDPVEYRLQGIVQVQVNEKAGLTFPSALRSILRQDPDVILVGEVRDPETAQVAVQASLTGHLVLTTLHTIDAVSSVTRLLDIGVETYKIAAAVKGVMAQRLVRKLCSRCRALAVEPVPERLKQWFPDGSALYRSVGCQECLSTGYHGRIALLEVLISNPEVERRIASGETAERLAEAARDGGMRGLWESGVVHVLNGVTCVEELLRVLGPPLELQLPAPSSRAKAATSASKVAPEAAEAPTKSQVAPPNARDAAAAGSRKPTITPLSTPVIPTAVVPPDRKASVKTRHSTPTSSSFAGGSFELMDGGGVAAKATSRKVLLVEDEDSLRRVLKDLLEREGFTVFEAADGVKALSEVDRAAPDIVVLDLNLPLLDGYGVLAHLRGRAATKDLPVIVLTAKGDEDSEVRVFEFGASDFLTKPFRPRVLSARLHALLNRDKE